MGSLQAESEEKLEMDDSGCIQDAMDKSTVEREPIRKEIYKRTVMCSDQIETPPCKQHNGHQGVQLLDLSDDVLLLILRFLKPRDLKALGYTCPRLGALVLDRSLWQVVDARAQPWSRARFRWYLARALHAGTRELLLEGYAREASQCLGHVNQTREEMEVARQLAGDKDAKEEDNNNTEADDEMEQSDSQSGQSDRSQSPRLIEVPSLGPNAQLFIDDSRDDSSESWAWPRASEPLVSDSSCPGPQFTLTACALRQLAATCPALTSLALEYCNINCNTTSIAQLPPTLKKLSLRGSKCYNLPLDRSFLFKIQDTMPDLESLDVSECEWMEPASLLPLSKLLALKRLLARDCLRLTEFVAYASLATRYGFTKLESLDLRGSPVGDSEVSALGWLPLLTHLWLSPARAAPAPAAPRAHSHHKRDALPRPPTPPTDKWEAMEPDYFKIKEPDCDLKAGKCDSEENKHTWQACLSQGLKGTPVTGNNSTQSSIENSLSLSNTTQSNTPSPKASQTATPSQSKSFNSSPGLSKSPNLSQCQSSSSKANQSPGQSKTPNSSPGQSTSPSPFPGQSMSPSPYPGQSKSPSPSQGQSKSPRPFPGQSKSPSPFPGQSMSPSSSPGQSKSPSPVPGQSNSPSPSPGQSKSPSPSPGQSKFPSPCPGQSKSPSPSPAQSKSPSPCPGQSKSPSPSPAQSKSPMSKSKAPKRKPSTSPSPGPSKRKRDDSDTSSSSDDDEDLPLKCLIKKVMVNVGASTSREVPEVPMEEELAEDAEVQPRHHVLYVNVGQQVHAVYRLSIDNEHVVTFNRNPTVRRVINNRNFLSPPGVHLDASSLVTDSAIRRFGRADGEDINYVHIGPNGPCPAPTSQGARPDRSSLTHLSVTGFRYVTDSSLNHLATSAPFLRFLDLTETNVTEGGVANFRSLRPECEVRFSKYVKKD